MTLPIRVLAQDCNPHGYTIIFVNGIFNSLSEAEKSKIRLAKLVASQFWTEPVDIRLGYNPSHLGGAGDLVQSVFQAFTSSISSYDLNTILMQIHPEVTTRKILLVGHSQGSFYTNEMYDYLTTHGVPKESIAVYNIGTPASFVAGGGRYVTSSNDKIINKIRDAEINGNVRLYVESHHTVDKSVVASALRANTTIPKEDGWDANEYGGHGFDVYLDGAGNRIVKDIQAELEHLNAAATGEATDEGCFIPPTPTVAYKAEKALLSVGDVLAPPVKTLVQVPIQTGIALLKSTRGLFADVIPSVVRSTSTLFGNSETRVGQVAGAVLAVDGQLASNVPSQTKEEQSISPAPAPVPEASAETVPVTDPVLLPEQVFTPPTIVDAPSAAPVAPSFSVSPGFGGGGSVASTQQTVADSPSAAPTVALSIETPDDNAIIASTAVTFTGTADSGAIVVADAVTTSASTTADSVGAWTLSLALAEGIANVTFIATDTEGNRSTSITRTLTLDITPPAAVIATAQECLASLSATDCLVATTTVALSWSEATDAVYYGLAQSGVVSATTSNTALSSTVAADSSTTLNVVSYDRAGNSATSSNLSIRTVSQPVIISEIGWAGDGTDYSHQWIELKNVSAYTLDFSRLTLVRQDGSSITLSGSIAPTGDPFLVVEPMEIAFTGTQKVVTPFSALSTSTAEQISLVWNASTTIDQTPTSGTCTGWCAGEYLSVLGSNVSGIGDLYSPLSMERISGATDGALAASWQDTDSYNKWIIGGNAGALWGTPANENSYGLPEAGVYCGDPSNLVVEDAPYHPTDRSCVFLTRFITGGGFGVNRMGGLYRGTIASSTGGVASFGKALADVNNNVIPDDAQEGEDFFFAIWELRSFGTDNFGFNTFFTIGASSTLGVLAPPHGNYITIPFTYSP